MRTERVALSAIEVPAYEPPAWPEPHVPKQIHLDLAVSDLETAAAEPERLGAALAGSSQPRTSARPPTERSTGALGASMPSARRPRRVPIQRQRTAPFGAESGSVPVKALDVQIGGILRLRAELVRSRAVVAGGS